MSNHTFASGRLFRFASNSPFPTSDIIYRYGYPHIIITDNGTNFAKGTFACFYGEKGIRMDLTSVAHPQSNGQVEKANGLVLASIKHRLVDPLERSLG